MLRWLAAEPFDESGSRRAAMLEDMAGWPRSISAGTGAPEMLIPSGANARGRTVVVNNTSHRRVRAGRVMLRFCGRGRPSGAVVVQRWDRAVR